MTTGIKGEPLSYGVPCIVLFALRDDPPHHVRGRHNAAPSGKNFASIGYDDCGLASPLESNMAASDSSGGGILGSVHLGFQVDPREEEP